jgi:hypothetical protein
MRSRMSYLTSAFSRRSTTAVFVPCAAHDLPFH